jgi:hypothetical protein
VERDAQRLERSQAAARAGILARCRRCSASATSR